jgi:hypothetical protein
MSGMNLNYAEGWRPEEGDTLIGTVTDVSIGRSNFGGSYPIVTVQPDDGTAEVAVHGFHAALRARFMELQPEPGERIGIKFVAKEAHKSAPGQTVAKYIVRIEGRGTANVWGNLAADDKMAPVPQSDVPEGFTPVDTPPAKPDADDDIPF